MDFERGIRGILNSLERDDVLNLAATVTQGLLKNKLESKQEAINAIIKYSPDETSIMKRKAITRELLFTYLHNNNIPVPLPATKNDLIFTIISHWELESNSSKSSENNSENNDITTLQKPTLQESKPTLQETNPTRQEDKPNVSLMAVKFTEWFYTILNKDERIGSEHFWADAKLKLNLLSESGNKSEQVDSDPEEIAQVLFKTKDDYKLYFNPNLTTEGVQGRMDPHGLVCVLSCGTLHTDNVCAGVFEQVFMLARDPFSDNNWKIKTTELILRSKGDVSAPPLLTDSALTRNLLALPSS